MKILATTLIIWLTFLINLSAQKNVELSNVKDSIAKYSILLSGKWQFIGYFKENKSIETILWSSISDSINETVVSTDSGLIRKAFLNSNLISISKYNLIDLIELEFEENGQGSYQYIPDYNPKSNLQTFMTCQPIPEIKYENGIYTLHFITMTEEYEREFRLQDDFLILRQPNGIEQRYIRYKSKNSI